MPNERNVGEMIAAFRKENNITQEELAEYLFVTRQAVSNWERGVSEPDFSTLEKICGRLGIGMEQLTNANKEKKQIQTTVKNDKEKCLMSKYDVAIGLFYGASFFIGLGLFFIIGLSFNAPMMWAVAFFAGSASFLILGLASHGAITLARRDKQTTMIQK